MAIRTVSDAGGEWSSAATWVGGVKPISGKDSVAFTATSGNLLITSTDVTIRGIDFRNYVNTLTLKGVSIIIDDTNTSGRAAFINFGTGGYTVVVRDNNNNIINPIDNIKFGIIILPTLSQVVTITSNGTAWPQYIQFQFSPQNEQIISLADNCTINGRWDMNGVIFQNNRLILNGNPIFDISIPGSEYASTQYFYKCTSTIEINSPQFYFTELYFDGNRLELNSPIVETIYSGFIQFFNTLGTPVVAVITTPNVISSIYNNTTNLTLTANILSGDLNNDNGIGTFNFTNINGNVQSILAPGYQITLNVSGTINGNLDISNDYTSITANTINSPTNCSVYSGSDLIFNVQNLNSPELNLHCSETLTIGTFTNLNITQILYLRTDKTGGILTYTLPNLNLTTAVTLQAATTNITFADLTVPLVTVTSSASATLSLSSTTGSINQLTITSPTAVVNKNNCSITTATITSTTSTTINGTTNNTLTTLNSNTPLLILDAANVMNSSTVINLTTTVTRTIQLTSAMNISSIVGLNANTTNLTFTGSFGATIDILDKFASLKFTVGNSYLVTSQLNICHCAISSVTAGTKATFNVGDNCKNLLINCPITDINASLTKRGLQSFYGTVSNCTNVHYFSDNTLPQATFIH